MQDLYHFSLVDIYIYLNDNKQEVLFITWCIWFTNWSYITHMWYKGVGNGYTIMGKKVYHVTQEIQVNMKPHLGKIFTLILSGLWKLLTFLK